MIEGLVTEADDHQIVYCVIDDDAGDEPSNIYMAWLDGPWYKVG